MTVSKYRFNILVIAILFLLNAQPLYSCGPYWPSTIFSYTYHPDYPLSGFVSGQLGILNPKYSTPYLFVAYRYLKSNKLDNPEQGALLEFFEERQKSRWDFDNDWVKRWIDSRKEVPGAPAIDRYSINIYRNEKNDNKNGLYYLWYLNCNEDAFVTAQETLSQRIKLFGANSDATKEWLAAQDMVFSNCKGGSLIPPPTTDAEPQIVKVDRAYQIAAAHFYSGDLDKAETEFRAIARDGSSPWSGIAPYLVARTLVRKASLSAGLNKNDITVLERAEAELRNILQNKGLTKIHPSASTLLDLVLLRKDPEKRVSELAAATLKPHSGTSLKPVLSDYLYLLRNTNFTPPDELTDWIRTFEKGNLDYALKKWKETHSVEWLLSSIAHIKADNPAVPELLEEANRVPIGSEAFLTVNYHVIRLLSESGKKDEAIRMIEALLANKEIIMPPSSLNLLLPIRMKLARNLQDFLTYAKRSPVGIFYDYDDYEIPETGESFEQPFREYKHLQFFDRDFVDTFNYQMPLSVIDEAGRSSALPANLLREIAISAWVRAVLLDKEAAAVKLATTLRELAPELKNEMNIYLAEQTSSERKFAAIFTMLRNPGIQPYLKPGIGRLTPYRTIDNLRDNWWCSQKRMVNGNETYLPPRLKTEYPSFFTQKERDEAIKERDSLSRIPTAPDYLAMQVLERAKQKPDDERIPEALHLVVKSTRYGCTDDATSRFSKEAFRVLHRRYPENAWSKKTPYWF